MSDAVVAFAVALVASAVATPVAAALGAVAGVVDRPDGSGLKIHTRPVPLTGGYGVLAALFAGALVADARPSLRVSLAILLAFAVGAVDDRVGLAPPVRLGVFAAAGLLVAADVAGGPGVSIVAVGLAVSVPNGVNLVDGQDALAGATAMVAAIGIAVIGSIVTAEGTATSAALAGALAGFLVWNRPPARVFLGNGGAYAVGLALAAEGARLVAASGAAAVLAVGAVLFVYLAELGVTVGRRVLGRRPLASGDRSHTYDVLANRIRRSWTLVVVVGVGVLGTAAGVAVAATTGRP